jgi:hypothetical protein
MRKLPKQHIPGLRKTYVRGAGRAAPPRREREGRVSHVYITVRIDEDREETLRRPLPARRPRRTELIHAGSFPTQKEARARRDLVAGELAAGRDPQLVLAALKTPAPKRTLAEWFDAFVDSRVDVSDATIRNYKTQATADRRDARPA